MSKLHEGRVAIVTGASTGVGLATAKELAKEGAKVTLVARNKEKLNSALSGIKQQIPGVEVMAVSADITSSNDIKRFVEETVKAFGTVDYLVNNAAYDGPKDNLIDYDIGEIKKVITTNLIAIAETIQAVAPVMVKKGKGSIVNVASIAGLYGTPTLSPYSASKHGLIGLTKSIAGELGPKGVRVNATAPGAIKTEMLEGYIKQVAEKNKTTPEEVEKTFGASIPLRCLSTTEEQAYAISFLLSDKASFISGAILVVDGGQSALLSGHQ